MVRVRGFKFPVSAPVQAEKTYPRFGVAVMVAASPFTKRVSLELMEPLDVASKLKVNIVDDKIPPKLSP